MVHDPLTWRMKARCAALASISAAMAFAYFDGSVVHAQGIMRSPSINISSRIPSINPTVTPHINPNIAGTAVNGIGRTDPNLRTYSGCSAGYRDSDRDGISDRREWNRDRDHDGRPDQYDRYDNRRDRHGRGYDRRADWDHGHRYYR